MKYSEFKKMMDDYGVRIERSTFVDRLYVYLPDKCDTQHFISVDTDIVDSAYIDLGNAQGYEIPQILDIAKLAFILARTPLAERGEEPRFYVKLEPETVDRNSNWLYQGKDGTVTSWISSSPRPRINEFTFDKSSYKKLLHDNPEWRPFLPKYDPENIDIFVPVEAGDQDEI